MAVDQRELTQIIGFQTNDLLLLLCEMCVFGCSVDSQMNITSQNKLNECHLQITFSRKRHTLHSVKPHHIDGG